MLGSALWLRDNPRRTWGSVGAAGVAAAAAADDDDDEDLSGAGRVGDGALETNSAFPSSDSDNRMRD
jgi:hypothetical protein